MESEIVIPLDENGWALAAPKPGWRWHLVTAAVMIPSLLAAAWLIARLPADAHTGLKGGLGLYGWGFVVIAVAWFLGILIAVGCRFLWRRTARLSTGRYLIVTSLGFYLSSEDRDECREWRWIVNLHTADDTIWIEFRDEPALPVSVRWLLKQGEFYHFRSMVKRYCPRFADAVKA